MSGWTDVNLADISTSITPVAEGEYTFEVAAGAKFSDFDANRLEACATITDGEFAGRKLFFSYPDPNKQDWSPRVFKRLVESLGMDIEAGESPVQYLNRAAGLRFAAPVKYRKNEDPSAPVKVDLDIFKIRPAA
jgi:hypothetical protein